MMEGDLTKSAIKNNRWQLLEQRMMFVEKSMDERLCRVEASMKDLKDNEIAHLAEDIGKLKDDLSKKFGNLMDEIVKLKLWQARLMGAIGVVWIVIQIVLKVWK